MYTFDSSSIETYKSSSLFRHGIQITLSSRNTSCNKMTLSITHNGQ